MTLQVNRNTGDSPLVDTHLHLTWHSFAGQEPDVVQRAKDAGVATLIDLGTDLTSSRMAMIHAETFEGLYFAAGIHPNDAGEAKPQDLEGIRDLLNHPKCVAVGEIGLDFYRDHTDPAVQERWLCSQLDLARELGKPVVLYDRRASRRLLEVLRDAGFDGKSGPGGVFHCFAGDRAMVDIVIERGFYISFTGNITFKNTDRREVVAAVPLDRLLIETDSPFMAPVPHRGHPNEPAYLPYVAAAVASIQGRRFEEVAGTTTENAVRLFGLGKGEG
ncbi:MAG: TatD family hydrolase [bacterium]